MTELLEAALTYAGRGWPIIPLQPRGKLPLTEHGSHDATTDPAMISAWWDRWPDANVGIATGYPSGVVVVDIDRRHGGTASLEQLERAHGRLPKTVSVLTGSGGQHIYLAHPGVDIRNSAGRLGEGIDVRGEGGYVVAPPSIHASGNPYRWRTSEGELPRPPAWLLEQAKERRNGHAPTLAADELIPEGQRNDQLASLGGTMRRRGMSEAAILAALRSENERRCKPPLSDVEVEAVARSIGRYAPAVNGARSTEAGEGGERETSRRDRSLVARSLVGVEMKSIEWHEKPLWQKSAFELLAGPKGAGKGTYLAGLAARFTRDGYSVLFISTEDSTAIDLKPRLVAAGADLERCFDLTEHVLLPDDVEKLRALAGELDRLGMFVIDPVANHIGDSNSNNDGEVRHAIGPLNKLADDLGCLVIGVRHPGKDRSRGAVASILGSTAWVDTPRAVVFIAVDDDDPLLRHIQVVSGNRSLNGAAQAFRIEAVAVDGLKEPITRAIELGASTKDVETLLAAASEQSNRAAPKRDEAKEIILDELAGEPRQLDYLKDICAARAGISGDSTYRAARELKAEGRVRCSNSGPGTPWLWSLAALTFASDESRVT